MHLEPTISVIINGNSLQTVSAVKTKNETHRIGGECEITVPLNSIIKFQNNKYDYLTSYFPLGYIGGQPQQLFKVGDPVSITAQYKGYASSVSVFNGYVFDFVEGMPSKIKCLDSVYLLNTTIIEKLSFKSITLKNLLTTILATIPGNPITLMLPMPDMELVNISFGRMSPGAIIESLKKDLMFLNISLRGNQLFVNLPQNTVNTVKLDTRVNVIKSGLQKPETVFQQYQVTAHFVLPTGKKASLVVGSGVNRDVWFTALQYNLALFQQMAQQALIRVQQHHFGGEADLLLYPAIQIYDKVVYSDYTYPDKNGNYVCIAHGFEIGDHGYRQKAKLAFLDDVNIAA